MKGPAKAASELLCPSAPPDWQGAVAIGVVGGSAEAPHMTPLEKAIPVSDALLALAAPVPPTEVFRFAAPCAKEGCRHFGAGACQLAAKVVQMLAPAAERLPFCIIRADCRWFAEAGRDACMRCPQVVTDNVYPTVAMHAAADPGVTAQDAQTMPPLARNV